MKDNTTNDYYCYLNYETLVEKGYLDSDQKDPKTNTEFDNDNVEIKITKVHDSNKYTYSALFYNDSTSREKEVECGDTYAGSEDMLLWYDGINNTGTGHDGSATTWVDLSGNGNDGVLNGPTWNSNYLAFDGVDDYVEIGDGLTNLYDGNNTIELLMLFNESGRDILIGNHNAANNINIEKLGSNNLRIYYNSGQVDSYSGNNFITINNKVSMSFVFNKSTHKFIMYNNNTNGTFNVDNSNFSNTAKWNSLKLGRDTRTGDTALKGNVYSVKIYNSALSDEEVAHNYAIDKQRFNIPD